jgi:hypothetical protein
MSRDDLDPLPPSSIPLVTPTKARDIARSLKSLADEYTKIGMHRDEANCMMRGSEWWLAYAVTLERAEQTILRRPVWGALEPHPFHSRALSWL